ncbi:MAG: hypothetical protein WA977_12935 [Halobacteriota archaeon]
MESGAIRRKGLKSRLLGANPPYHLAAHHAAFFYKCTLQGAIDFAVLPILARRGRLCT